MDSLRSLNFNSPIYLVERDGTYAMYALDPKEPAKNRIYLRPTESSAHPHGRKIMGYVAAPSEFESPKNYVFIISPADVLICLAESCG